jgi:hypothetical protein
MFDLLVFALFKNRLRLHMFISGVWTFSQSTPVLKRVGLRPNKGPAVMAAGLGGSQLGTG